jgi:hypothetical protein
MGGCREEDISLKAQDPTEKQLEGTKRARVQVVDHLYSRRELLTSRL